MSFALEYLCCWWVFPTFKSRILFLAIKNLSNTWLQTRLNFRFIAIFGSFVKCEGQAVTGLRFGAKAVAVTCNLFGQTKSLISFGFVWFGSDSNQFVSGLRVVVCRVVNQTAWKFPRVVTLLVGDARVNQLPDQSELRKNEKLLNSINQWLGLIN